MVRRIKLRAVLRLARLMGVPVVVHQSFFTYDMSLKRSES